MTARTMSSCGRYVNQHAAAGRQAATTDGPLGVVRGAPTALDDSRLRPTFASQFFGLHREGETAKLML
jgi:hypothetical protein